MLMAETGEMAETEALIHLDIAETQVATLEGVEAEAAEQAQRVEAEAEHIIQHLFKIAQILPGLH